MKTITMDWDTFTADQKKSYLEGYRQACIEVSILLDRHYPEENPKVFSEECYWIKDIIRRSNELKEANLGIKELAA